MSRQEESRSILSSIVSRRSSMNGGENMETTDAAPHMYIKDEQISARNTKNEGFS